MFLTEWFKKWIRSWILYFWLMFINLLSSKEAVSATDDGIIYIDEDRFPVKRKSIDGKDDYMRVVQSAGEIRNRVPKKEPLKRTKSSGGVNSLVDKFEKRSKSLDQEDEEPKTVAIRKPKRLEPFPPKKLERKRSSEKYEEDTMHAPRPKEEVTEAPENTDDLWNQLVAQYAANETIEQVATLRSFSKESTEKEDPDELLDKLLSRIENEPAELDIERKPAVTGEIEAQLEKAMNEGESRGEDQIFIVFEDSTDNDSDEHPRQEVLPMPESEETLPTQISPIPSIIISKDSEDIPKDIVIDDKVEEDETLLKEPVVKDVTHQDQLTDDNEVETLPDTDIRFDKSFLSDSKVKDETQKDQSIEEKAPPTINIVVQSVTIEPCSSIPLDIDSIIPDEAPAQIDDAFEALWKEAEPTNKNIEDLYEECVAPTNIMVNTSKDDEQGEILLPTDDGAMPKEVEDVVKPTIIVEDTKCHEVISVKAKNVEKGYSAQILKPEQSEEISKEINDKQISSEPNIKDTPIKESEPIEADEVEVEETVTNSPSETICDKEITESLDQIIPEEPVVLKDESDVEISTDTAHDEQTTNMPEMNIPSSMESVDGDVDTSSQPNVEDEFVREEPFMTYITSSSSVVIIDEDDPSMENEEPMVIDEERVVPDIEDHDIEVDMDMGIDEVLNKLASAHPQGNGLLEAFAIPEGEVTTENSELIVTYPDDEDMNIPTCVPTGVHCSSPSSKMMIDPCKIEEMECSSPTPEEAITALDLMKVSRQLSNGTMKLKSRFGLADIPEEQEPSESMDQEDTSSELSDDCFEPETPKVTEKETPPKVGQAKETGIPTYLEEVKDLLVPRARRKKQKHFKELDEIMKVDEDKVKPRVNIFASREDLTNLTDSEEEEAILSAGTETTSSLNPELFTEEERVELSELSAEEEQARALKRKELEKYLSLPSALTEQEHQELAELLAEEETEKRLDLIGEERLARFLEDVRKRMAEGESEENDLNHYMNLPLHLTKEEQELLEDEEDEKTRADFQTDDEYKEYIKQRYLEDLEAERIQVEEEYGYSDYSDSYDSNEDYDYEDNEALHASNIPITTNTL